MKISFFNRKNTSLVNHALEVRRYDKQLTANWKILKTADSPEAFEKSLKLVEESIEAIKRIAGEVDPYVDLSAVYDYEKELEENRGSWYEAVKERAE